MFQKLEQSSGSVVGVRISGTLTEEDYQHLVPEFERIIAEHGELNLVCRFDGFTGIEPEAVWEDLRFDVRHLRDVSRCAVVKDEDWQGWLVRLAAPVAGIDVRVFEAGEDDEAWRWIRQEAGEAPGTGPERRARAHRRRLQALVERLRRDAARTDDPHAEALFETAAETLGGLSKAFDHYETRAEEAWKGG